jgi:hypothetical protein
MTPDLPLKKATQTNPKAQCHDNRENTAHRETTRHRCQTRRQVNMRISAIVDAHFNLIVHAVSA